jgi:hypothetical protein
MLSSFCASAINEQTGFYRILALIDAGSSLEQLNFDFTYPGTRDKADIAVIEPESSAVFELKSFARSGDANKIARFPQQIAQLELHDFFSSAYLLESATISRL